MFNKLKAFIEICRLHFKAACLIIIVMAIGGRYLYLSKLRPIIYDYRFEQALKMASEIPDDYWEEKYKNMPIKNSYKVVFVTNNGGEYSYAKYFQYSAERMGWEVKVFFEKINSNEVLGFNPDFIIFTREVDSKLDMEIIAHSSKKYLVLFSSMNTFRNALEGVISKKYPFMPNEHFGKLIKICHAVTTSAKDLDMYRIMFDTLGKRFNGFRMLSTVPRTQNKAIEHNNLMWIGTGWDDYRNSKNFRKFIDLISKNISVKIYGYQTQWHQLPTRVYDGFIAPGVENIKAIRNNGIYLLTNSDWHFKSGEPGMRIFEAVAANAVVISDKHPFAIEHFGDNFLYFDQNADAETMYKQVKAHYDWIKANPEKAKAMAARAHQIFLEKFTLEKDLVRIAKMHEYIVRQEKEMGLSYPLVY